MASITIRTGSNGRRWRVQYRDPQGRQHAHYDMVRLMTVDGLVATLGPVRRRRKLSDPRRASVTLPGDPKFARRVAAQNAWRERARAGAS